MQDLSKTYLPLTQTNQINPTLCCTMASSLYHVLKANLHFKLELCLSQQRIPGDNRTPAANMRTTVFSESTVQSPGGIYITRNLSGDEKANVNFLYDNIVHVIQNTIDSCINSATDRRGYVLERMCLPNSVK